MLHFVTSQFSYYSHLKNLKKMKTLKLAIVLVSTFIIASCGQKAKEVDMTNCKGHERNCPVSEDCPEHPECEAHEKCVKGEACKKHPSCVAYDKEKAN